MSSWSVGTMPTRYHWKNRLTAKMMKGVSAMALGMLMWGYLISSLMEQQASKPAKHHQIMATLAITLWGPKERKSGFSTKLGRLMLGIIIKNHTMATPQKKNMKALAMRPVISTPLALRRVKNRMHRQASTRSLTGSSTPKAENMVLK